MSPIPKFGSNTLALLAIVLTATMLAQPMSLGYATDSYTATTVSSDNSLSANYFTAGLYSHSGADNPGIIEVTESTEPDFTPADNVVKSGELAFTYSDHKVSGDNVVITPSNLYLIIHPLAVTGSPTFNIGSHSIAIFDGEDQITSGVSSTVTMGDPTMPTIDMSANTAYKLTVKITIQETTISSDTLTCNFVISSIIEQLMQGAYAVQGCNITLTTHSQPITDIIQDNEDISDQGFELDPIENSPEYNGNPAVNISSDSNEHGILPDGNGSITVNVNVPTGYYFILSVYNDNPNGVKKEQTFNLTITGFSTKVITIPSINNSNLGKHYYIFKDGNNLSDPTLGLPTTDKWIQSTGTVTVHIQRGNSGGNTALDSYTKVDIVLMEPT